MRRRDPKWYNIRIFSAAHRQDKLSLLEWSDYPPFWDSSWRFWTSAAVLTFSIFSSSILKNSCWLSEEWMLLHAKRLQQSSSETERRNPAVQLQNCRNLQYLPVWTGFIQGLLFPEEGTFLLQEKLKSKLHLLITNKPTKHAVSVQLERWERHTVLSEPSTPPSSALRYLTFSTPFVLYSSVTEGEEHTSC